MYSRKVNEKQRERENDEIRLAHLWQQQATTQLKIIAQLLVSRHTIDLTIENVT